MMTRLNWEVRQHTGDGRGDGRGWQVARKCHVKKNNKGPCTFPPS